MTTEQLKELFHKYDNDFLHFERVVNPHSTRPDLHAFILLDKLVPGTIDMVCYAIHDEICLDVMPDALSPVVSEEQVLELIRCGVRFSGRHGCLALFV